MTAVLFKFVHPDGTPVVDTPFVVTLRKSSFDEALGIGILLPGDVEGVTDAQGTATLELAPGFGTYYLTMSDLGTEASSDGCTAGLRYRFQVPESATPVRVEDIIVTTPTFSRPWDEVALQVILDAKSASVTAANEAEAARDVALEQTGIIDGIAEETRVAAAAALVSQNQSAISADTATTKAAEAAASAAAALVSKNAAAVSELAAYNSAQSAAGSDTNAHAFADAAALSATSASNSASAAAGSAGAAAAAAADTAADKLSTAADRVAVAADKVTVTALKDETKVYRDEAQAALGTIVGVISDGGSIDLSSGVYPAKPNVSTVWRVVVGGTVLSDSVVYEVSDQLFYTESLDYFYKVDSTDNVTSVAGRKGAVVVTQTDVGLPNVDNTSDLNKPISTATAAGLALKIDKTAIVDDLTSTDPTKVLSAKQGKVLYDLVQANKAAIVRYTYTLTTGQTTVSGPDTAGVALTYDPGTAMLVELNGFPLYKTNDYTATTGNSLTLTTGVEANSELAITVFGAFSLVNHYTKEEDDAKFAVVQADIDEHSRENVIINGNFSLWQRGVSFVDPAHFTTTVDRFVFGQSSGTAKFTVAQSADVPNAQSQFSMDIAVTQAYTPTANDEAHIRYGLEGREGLVKVAGKVVTYSFWAKSNVVGIHSLTMVHPNATRSSEETWVAEYTILAANTWEKKTITVDLGTATGGWSYAGATYGLKIRFCFYAGTTYRAQPGQWTPGNFVGSVNQVNLAGTVGNYLRIAQFKLEAGSKASAFAPEDIIDTLRKCQRYFYLVGGAGDVFGFSAYTGTAAEQHYVPFTFPTTMCKVPVVSTSGPFTVANTAQPTFEVSQTGGRIITLSIAAGRMAARSNGVNTYFDAEF